MVVPAQVDAARFVVGIVVLCVAWSRIGQGLFLMLWFNFKEILCP